MSTSWRPSVLIGGWVAQRSVLRCVALFLSVRLSLILALAVGVAAFLLGTAQSRHEESATLTLESATSADRCDARAQFTPVDLETAAADRSPGLSSRIVLRTLQVPVALRCVERDSKTFERTLWLVQFPRSVLIEVYPSLTSLGVCLRR